MAVNPVQVAEDLHAFAPVAKGVRREDWGEVVLVDQGVPAALFATASRVRFGPDPEDSIRRVRGWFAGRGRAAFTWYLGPSSTPGDLEERLRAHGAAEDPAEPEHTAMVLDRPPLEASYRDRVRVRLVETFEDYCLAADIFDVGFGGSFTAEEVTAMRAQRADKYVEYAGDARLRRYLALVDEVPVAAASGVVTDVGVMLLGGGATLPQARGRGAYRALVQARWDDAISQGCPALVTQASEMSRPILASMGFVAVGRIVELLDSTS